MCGGAGTRLWPSSREGVPQFVWRPLDLQDTMLRVSDPSLFARPVIITNAMYRFMVLEQLERDRHRGDILLEFLGAISARLSPPARLRLSRDPTAVVLALRPITWQDTAAFVDACRAPLSPSPGASSLSACGRKVPPPNTATSARPSPARCAVARFVEKPTTPPRSAMSRTAI